MPFCQLSGCGREARGGVIRCDEGSGVAGGDEAEDESLLPSAAFHVNQRVFDLIYMYPETAFMSVAREAGAAVANGLGMLFHQGARAFTIWTEEDPDVDVMRRSLEEAVYGGNDHFDALSLWVFYWVFARSHLSSVGIQKEFQLGYLRRNVRREVRYDKGHDSSFELVADSRSVSILCYFYSYSLSAF